MPSFNKSTEKGIINEALPDTNFRVELETGEIILAYLSGKMRMYHIKVGLGDTVMVEVSSDRGRGRIIKRL